MATAETKIHVSEFTNEPFLDFAKPENRAGMEAALKKVAGEFGKEYPMYIGGKQVFTTAKMMSVNPSHPTQVIAVFQSASAEQANEAVELANKAFGSWKRVPAEQRAECLFRIAKILRERRHEMNAIIC
jgi:1-pyrroline-5-carboxylate dehydrogenase